MAKTTKTIEIFEIITVKPMNHSTMGNPRKEFCLKDDNGNVFYARTKPNDGAVYGIQHLSGGASEMFRNRRYIKGSISKYFGHTAIDNIDTVSIEEVDQIIAKQAAKGERAELNQFIATPAATNKRVATI